mmetsp:Transcript_34767/g.106814  ORF Transcript_34767/g.106814 Transcript_34767/m.106814 type:complete len:101 (+) Transcript_34767:246-548(+)
MAALDGALPRIDAAPGAAPPANRVADALAALEAELAAQDEQFTKLANAMSLTASSLDELYARADADGGAAPHQNMIATLAEIERDFKADAADVPSGTRTR